MRLKNTYHSHYLFLLAAFVGAFFLGQNMTYAQETPGCYFDSLAASESGGCGGGDQYNCMGPVINNGGMHHGDRPLGKYQFMPNTLRGMGIDPNNFVGNGAAQEAAIRQFTAQNDACLQRSGAYNYIGQVRNGVTITRTGLLGAAHLGGCGGASRWASGRGGGSDQLGTSLADYAAKFATDDAGNCGADFGLPDTAEQFAQAQASGLVGCNPALLNGMRQQQQALQQAETEAAKAIITKPTSVQQLTCFDQYTQLNAERIGRIHANPSSGIGGSIVPNVELPNIQNLMQNFLSGITGGGLQSMLSGAISSLGLGGAGGASGSAGNCPMMDQMWDLLQCMDFPQMPSLNDIMGGKMNELSGILSGLGSIGNGQGLMGQVCSAVSGLMGGGGSGNNNAFENAAKAMADSYHDGAEGMFDNGRGEELSRIAREVANGTHESDDNNQCDYASLVSSVTNMAADLNGNNIIEASELRAIDANNDCQISADEIAAASGR